MIPLKRYCASLLLIAGLSVSATPSVADGQFVTGDEWTASSELEKLAYVMGISNLMSADYFLQKEDGWSGGSAIQELYIAAESVSIEQTVGMIDSWYAANPEDLGEPVLDVIWLTLVER